MPVIDATRWLVYYPELLDTRKTLWLVRNVMDVDALKGSGINAVAAQGGEKDLECSAKFFQQFPALFVAMTDNDGDSVRASAVADEIADYCPRLPILTPKQGAFGKFKTVADMLRGGKLRASHLLMGAIERPIKGLLDLADVSYVDLSKIPAVLSGIPFLDKATGGFRAGELSIVTGKRGSGKSTLYGQFLLDGIDQGFPVCAYSGELPAPQFKSWIVQQAAGPQYVQSVKDPRTEKWYSTVSKDVLERINYWLRGAFYLYDSEVRNPNNIDGILEVFTYAVRRYGCMLFLADNLMTIQTGVSGSDYWRKQGEVVGKLKDFAKIMKVHVFLVAHPRKGETKDSDDVSGNSEVTDRADNVYIVDRLSEDEVSEQGFDAALWIKKNRFDGELDNVRLCYDKASRRFYSPNTRPEDK
ncbi:MAG: hypothetical protein J6X53_10235, partial [Abditibacteriota bacterium]|nr:hypothetical protein [Abditibacteriota bacterium]